MKIGIPLVFSGKAPQVKFIAETLKNLGLNIIVSSTTTPELWEKALFLGSNETCLPVRIYIAHCHKLVNDNKVNVLITPNLWREVDNSAACSKYRDVGGLALRALSSIAGYALGKFPYIVQPDLISLKKKDLLPVIKEIISELYIAGDQIGKALPKISSFEIKRAFDNTPDFTITKEVALEDKPRIGIIARRYLLDDPLLSVNIKKFFTKKGFQVLTPYDLPDRYFTKDGLPFGSYYDTHLQGENFLTWGRDKLSGVIILSSFACHPDSFQGEYFTKKATELGLLSWHFVCDSTFDLGGFITRFETIATLLEQRSHSTLEKTESAMLQNEALGALSATVPHTSTFTNNKNKRVHLSIMAESKPTPKTIVTWPYMGEPLNIALKQLAFDLGAFDITRPPKPVTEQTLKRGSEELAETCCPYALISGSLEETILEAYHKTKAPLDAQILMLHGEGPCAFGWYSIAMQEKLPQRLTKETSDISVNWITTGIDQPADFWKDLGSLCDAKRHKFLNTIKTPLSFFKPTNLKDTLPLARNILTKLHLAEEIRKIYLLARAFGGKVTEEAYYTALKDLDDAKNTRDMEKSFACSKDIFSSIVGDKKAPQVIVVGEIYVAITPYANRYTVDRLLGDCGLQVIEGISVSHYLQCSIKPALRRFLRNLAPIEFLNKQGLKLFAQGLRDADAAPFMNFEVGGDGILTTGAARRALQGGIAGVVHIYPLNCMPEVLAKPAVRELTSLYNVPYLGLSFNRETDTERLITEVLTFSRLIKTAKKA